MNSLLLDDNKEEEHLQHKNLRTEIENYEEILVVEIEENENIESIQEVEI